MISPPTTEVVWEKWRLVWVVVFLIGTASTLGAKYLIRSDSVAFLFIALTVLTLLAGLYIEFRYYRGFVAARVAEGWTKERAVAELRRRYPMVG